MTSSTTRLQNSTPGSNPEEGGSRFSTPVLLGIFAAVAIVVLGVTGAVLTLRGSASEEIAAAPLDAQPAETTAVENSTTTTAPLGQRINLAGVAAADETDDAEEQTETVTEDDDATTEAKPAAEAPAAETPAAETPAPAPVDQTPAPVPAGGPTAEGWAKLRNCEASGNYQAINPVGYYGAYQFDQRTWDGTARSAGRSDLVGVLPSNAAPADQDAMAFALYDARGAQPWPNCGRFIR